MPLKKNERVSARIPSNVYDKLTQAAELVGATLNQFLIQSALEKAQMVIEKERVINMTMESAKLFFNLIENPPASNDKLKNAIQVYKESFRDAKNINS